VTCGAELIDDRLQFAHHRIESAWLHVLQVTETHAQ
jgi:hypothetical protein